MANQLTEIYDLLLDRYGHQQWWPGETKIEVIVGAILTQNTNWGNVEKAIKNLKAANCLTVEKLSAIDISQLAELIRPSGYYNIKAKRLKAFINWLFKEVDGDLELLDNYDDYSLRMSLLSVKGIGRETADSIMLYGLNRPIFVIDTYTCRILVRHGLLDSDCDYEQAREYFESNLPQDTKLFNEFHALLVQVGKNHCKPTPKCDDCPLNSHPHQIEEQF